VARTFAVAVPGVVKVRVDAGGREVEVEAPGSTVEGLAAVALMLWRQTADAPYPVTSQGFGLVSAERAEACVVSTTMACPVENPG
jgi:hypothetical protein